MIDIENQVIDKIYTALQTDYPGIEVFSEELYIPSSFPCVSIVEADNATYRRTRDSGNEENHALVMYEINVYSNKTTGKKQECKNIFSVIDDVLFGLNFTRLTKRPLNIEDASIYRMVGRYNAIVANNNTIYGR